MAGSAKHTQRTALVQLSQYNGDEHIFSGGMTGGVLTYDAGAGTGWSWRDAIGLNVATPAVAGTIEARMGVNGATGLRIRRFTDTGPTGNYLVCDNAAGSPLFYVTSAGVVNAPGGLVAPLTYMTDVLAVSQGGTGDTGTPWTSYTPTVSAGSGTITTASAVGRYKTLGKTVFFSVVATITTNGTGATAVNIGLPVAVVSASVGFHALGRDGGTGATLLGIVAGNASSIYTVKLADGSYPAVNGSSLGLSGVYESA